MKIPRFPLVLLALCACSSSNATEEEPPPPEPTAEEPAEEAEPEELPDWPEPELRVVVNAAGTRSVEVTLGEEHVGATVEMRRARGLTPPGCDAGTVVAANGDRAEVGQSESVSVCVRDTAGNVRARRDVLGRRQTLHRMVSRRGDRFATHIDVQPFDDDVEAVVVVAYSPEEQGEADEPQRCHVVEGYDPPEWCVYDCSEGRVVAEVARATMNTLVESPAYRAGTEGGRYNWPSALAIRLPFDLRRGEAPRLCVRTRDGALEGGRIYRDEPRSFPWYGCDWDTPAGECTYLSGTPRVGDALLAGAGDRRFSARVRRARTRRNTRVVRLVAAGRELSLAENEAVRGGDGEDILGRDIAEGTELLFGDEAVRVEARHEAHSEEWTRVDVEGASYILRNGFMIRDLGTATDASEAPSLSTVPFRAGPGPGDCSIEVAWRASFTESPVGLGVRATTGPRFGRATAQCDEPLVTVDAASLAAVSSLGPETEILVRLFGEAIGCDEERHVSFCAEGVEAPALWAQATPWCLPAGTMVDTPRGPRAIETLSRGDEVIAFDGQEAVATVTGNYTHDDRRLFEVRLNDGTLLEATEEHLVLVGAGFRPRPVSALRPGDELHMRGVRPASSKVEGPSQVLSASRGLQRRTVVSVTPGRRARVYELRVSAPDTYFANGVLVHNY